MIVRQQSGLTGKMNEMDLNITKDQLKRFESMDSSVQVIFPNLNAVEREFLMTGSTPEEWAEALPPDDED